jgi:pyruvate-formate lyase
MIPENKTTGITERIARLRSNILSAVPTVCTERAGIYTEIYEEFEDSPLILKRAYALEKTLKKMTIFIGEGELIVGNQSSKLRAAPVFPEHGTSWIINELDEFDKRPGDAFFINEKQKDELKMICSWWDGKTHIEKNAALMSDQNFTSGVDQITVNFEKVLETGLKAYLKNIEAQQKALNASDERFFEKQDFYNSLIIGINSFQSFIERFERLSYEMAECESEPVRKSELLRISDICGNITEYPPSGFYEALQLTWFIQLILQIENNSRSVSLGRMDQYLNKFYINDLLTGKINEDFALELLDNTWIKLLSLNRIRSKSDIQFSTEKPLYQNVTIGGQTKEGNDAVNKLSYLILVSVHGMKLAQPSLSVRIHKNINEDFLSQCSDVSGKDFEMPAFYNDEFVIPAIINPGISREDAYNYSAIGCNDIVIPGKRGYNLVRVRKKSNDPAHDLIIDKMEIVEVDAGCDTDLIVAAALLPG